MGREVQDGVYPMLAQQAVHERAITDIPHAELRAANGLPKSGDEIVEHDDPLAAFDELTYDVTAYVTGPAGHQNGRPLHAITPRL
jgi:hypothetical protein